jgi:hypothetical protein
MKTFMVIIIVTCLSVGLFLLPASFLYENEGMAELCAGCLLTAVYSSFILLLYNEGVSKKVIIILTAFLLAGFASMFAQTSVVGGLAVNNNGQELHVGIINGSEFPVVFMVEVAHEEWVINDLDKHNPADHLGFEAEFGWIGPNGKFLTTVGVLGYDRHVLPTIGVSRRLWDFDNSSLWMGVQLSPVRQEIGLRYFFNVTQPRYGSGCVFK